MDQAIIGLKAFKELDKAAERLWQDLDKTILNPRTNLPLDGRAGSLFGIQIQKVGDVTRDSENSTDDFRTVYLVAVKRQTILSNLFSLTLSALFAF